jgi:hypothetical protein
MSTYTKPASLVLTALSTALQAYCNRERLPIMSADDLLADHRAAVRTLTPIQSEWLTAYGALWDLSESEDAREPMPSAYMLKPILSAADADAFTRALVADGNEWHYDDNPPEFFPPAISDALSCRVREMRELPDDYDPFSLLVFLTNSPAEYLAVDAELLTLYGEGMTADQRDCLAYPERIQEARDMLDDMHARLDVSANAYIAALRALNESEE